MILWLQEQGTDDSEAVNVSNKGNQPVDPTTETPIVEESAAGVTERINQVEESQPTESDDTKKEKDPALAA